MDRYEIGYADEGSAFALAGNVVLCVLRTTPTVEQLRALRVETEKAWRVFGETRSGLTVVEASAIGDVSKEVRAESAALMRDFPQVVNVTVIEGRGFKAVAARAIVSGMALLSRSRNNNKLFDTVEEAATWMEARMPPTSDGKRFSAAELVALAGKTRAAVKVR